MGKAIEMTRSDRSARELRKLAVSTEDGDVVRRLPGMAPKFSPSPGAPALKFLLAMLRTNNCGSIDDPETQQTDP